jgi:hypothetical protein
VVSSASWLSFKLWVLPSSLIWIPLRFLSCLILQARMFMYLSLEKFGFQKSIIKWLRTLYSNIKGCILNNGWISSPFFKLWVLPSSLIWIPLRFLSCLILQARISTAITKINALNGQPWFPRFILKGEEIQHSDQNGYIKNRYIGFNIRQIQDIIDYADKFNVEGAILFLDFSKAFDSLEWFGYLWGFYPVWSCKLEFQLQLRRLTHSTDNLDGSHDLF